MKSLITLEVTHDEPVKNLAVVIANLLAVRPWSIEVVTSAHHKDADGFTVSELALGAGEVHRS